MNNRKTWFAVIILALLVAIAACCWFAFKPEAVLGTKNIVVEVTHKDGNVNVYEIETQAQYLYDALREQGLIGEITDGFFTDLDDEYADAQNEEWWGYTKAGEYVNFGVADCVIKDGDHYEFTFNVGW